MNENEQKCIDFALRRLETHFSQNRTDIYCPEDDPDIPTDMRIDAVATIGSKKFAIEHTMIEPFEGHHKHGVVTNDADADLRKHLKKLDLKVGIDVALPSNWGERFPKKKKRNAFIKALADLVITQKSMLENLKDDDIFLSIGEIEGIMIKVVRNDFETCNPPETCPYLILIAPENYSRLRAERIKRSLNDKLPKLSKWRENHQTILILENQDISLTSWRSVRSEVEKIWINEPLVDYLYLVGTQIEIWRLYPFVENGIWVAPKSDGTVQVDKVKRTDLSLIV